jgi:hypothetical protein
LVGHHVTHPRRAFLHPLAPPAPGPSRCGLTLWHEARLNVSSVLPSGLPHSHEVGA